MYAKMLDNGMVEINWKSTILTIRLSEVHGLMQDLPYLLKATTQTSDPKIIHEISFDAEDLYLAALTRIIINLVDQEMHVELSEHRERCRNNKPNQLPHYYITLAHYISFESNDPKIRAQKCFDVLFGTVCWI